MADSRRKRLYLGVDAIMHTDPLNIEIDITLFTKVNYLNPSIRLKKNNSCLMNFVRYDMLKLCAFI